MDKKICIVCGKISSETICAGCQAKVQEEIRRLSQTDSWCELGYSCNHTGQNQ